MWVVHTPIAVDPSLMASREYSTWKRRPSGENVLFKDLIVGFNYGFGIHILDAPICSPESAWLRLWGACSVCYHILILP